MNRLLYIQTFFLLKTYRSIQKSRLQLNSIKIQFRLNHSVYTGFRFNVCDFSLTCNHNYFKHSIKPNKGINITIANVSSLDMVLILYFIDVTHLNAQYIDDHLALGLYSFEQSSIMTVTASVAITHETV